MADALRDSERAHDGDRPRVGILTPMALSALGMMAAMPFDYALPLASLVIPLWFIAATAPFVGMLLLRGWRNYQHKRKLPHRWSLSPAVGTGPETRGQAVCPEPLRAPLTGRSCVAYELAVHTCDAPEAPLSQLTLVEQRCADLEVDGKPFLGRGVRLALRRQRVELDPANDEHRRLMHVRGLEPTGDAFVVYETIVEPQTVISITGTERASTLRAA